VERQGFLVIAIVMIAEDQMGRHWLRLSGLTMTNFHGHPAKHSAAGKMVLLPDNSARHAERQLPISMQQHQNWFSFIQPLCRSQPISLRKVTLITAARLIGSNLQMICQNMTKPLFQEQVKTEPKR